MSKKKKRTNKEKELKRKLEALKANQNIYINEARPSKKVEVAKAKKNNKNGQLANMNIDEVLADDSIIITDDKHIKADLVKTTIFTVVVTAIIIALKYFNPLI